MPTLRRESVTLHTRRALLQSAAAALLGVSSPSVTQAACETWNSWQQFKSNHVSDDGRVVDRGTPEHITTSEGQAYALLFALAANDRRSFQEMLDWTVNNLAQGDMHTHLPAWQWGRDTHNTWHVLDAHAASDADVWLAYVLNEAGRLWRVPEYTRLAHSLSNNILSQEATHVPGLGLALLPGPAGFVTPNAWRFNASYLPIQALRVLAREHDSAWRDIIDSSLRIIRASTHEGRVADWIDYGREQSFLTPTTLEMSEMSIGSYNAIRVYLWAGMLSPRDPACASLLELLRPALRQFDSPNSPAEMMQVLSGELQGTGSAGFSAAWLPLLKTLGPRNTFAQQRLRAQQGDREMGYYSDVLRLFGLGWVDGWLAFEANGALRVRWSRICAR